MKGNCGKFNSTLGNMKFDIEKHKDCVQNGKEWIEVRLLGVVRKYIVMVLNTKVTVDGEKKLRDFKEKEIQSTWIKEMEWIDYEYDYR